MNPVGLLIICLALMAFSLATVSVINRVQTRRRLIRQRTIELRRRVAELEEIISIIEPLMDTGQVPRILNEEVAEHIRTIRRLLQDDELMQTESEHSERLAQMFLNEKRSQPLSRLLDSDAAIAKAQHYIREAAVVLKKRSSHGLLSPTELESLLRELNWANLMVEVISFVGHGHKANERGDFFIAQGYYRKANGLVISYKQDEPRRHEYVRELSELLNKKRAALSRELMPEDQFNPKNIAPDPVDNRAAGNS